MAAKIEDYAFLSDTQTGALVSRDGCVDWLCFPRFDSGACFAALLGDGDNGRWSLYPREAVIATRRRYRGDSLILETEFETESGAVRLIDFMPPRGEAPDIIRIVEGLRGEVPMRLELTIRFDYGQIVPWVRKRDGGIEAIAGPDALILRTPVETHGEDLKTVAEFSVAAGERIPFVLTWFQSHAAQPQAVNAEHALAETESYWSDWAKSCVAPGPWREAVVRSLVTLKGLTYAPTGGIVAAATTSLPEEIGGVRNWDYRYCWLRDATFTLITLMNAGYVDEARAWREWLLRAVAGSPEQMQIMYGVCGERRLAEYEVPWLSGYENSQPVRVGNAASQSISARCLRRGARLDVSRRSRRPQSERGRLAIADGADPFARDEMGGARLRHLGNSRRAATFHALEDDGVGRLRSRGEDGRGMPLRTRGTPRAVARDFAIGFTRRCATSATTSGSARSRRSTVPTSSTRASS